MDLCLINANPHFKATLNTAAIVFCDPAATDFLTCPPPCGSGGPPCIVSWFWLVNNESSSQLDIGSYNNVWFPCAQAQRVTDFVLPSAAGVLNCASATHRCIDKGVNLLTGQPLQCIQGTEPNGPGSRIPGVGPYSNVFGQLYGLPYNQISGIFFSGDFTLEQYELVAQIMDYQRWFVAGVPFELLDAAPDYYMDQWVQHEQAD